MKTRSEKIKFLLIALVIFTVIFISYFFNFRSAPVVKPELPPDMPKKSCVVAGCSGQFCVDASVPQFATTCEYLDEYACYKYAPCEIQSDGKCGWTQNPQFAACMGNPALFKQ